jgi:hypothetical protein
MVRSRSWHRGAASLMAFTEIVAKCTGSQRLSIIICLLSAMSEIVSGVFGGHLTLCRRLHKLRRDEDQIELLPNAFCADRAAGTTLPKK